MNQYKSCSELKNLAKNKLEGFFGASMVVFVLAECVTYLCSVMTATLTRGDSTLSFIFLLLLNGITYIILGVLNTGLAYFFLSLFCGSPLPGSAIFYGFKNQPEKSIKIAAVHLVIDFVCTTPAQCLLVMAIGYKDLHYLKYWAIAFIIGYAILIPLNILLSQSYYLLVDFPNYTAKEAIYTSCKLMKKHFWKFLFLQISFLPLMVLGILSCGIGLLWIFPYKQMAYTCFYMDIVNPQKTSTD